MAPPRLYQLPNEQLVTLLAEARLEGLRFEDAWFRAVRPGLPLVLANAGCPPVGAVRWPTDSSDRLAWQAAIAGIKDDLRRAYERRPATRRERAVVILVDTLSGGIAARTAVRSPA